MAGKSNKQCKLNTVKRIMDILRDHSDIPPEDLDMIHRWFADHRRADTKTKVFVDAFSDAVTYDENPVYAREMWVDLANRLGFDPDIIHKPVPDSPHSPVAGARIPLRKRLIFRIAVVLTPFFVTAAVLGLQFNRTSGTAGNLVADGVTVSVPTDAEQTVIWRDSTSEMEVHTLPDHSTVRLGRGSEIRHREAFGDERRVELKGEARFCVTRARIEGDYFTVHTEHLDIKVLGTDFYVRSPADERYSTIDLYHGTIEVGAGGETFRMRPTDHLRFDHRTREVTLTTIPYGGLRYDQMPGLVFRNATMTDVLTKLADEFGIAIRIEGSLPADQTRVEGDLTMVKTLDELMRRLEILSGRFAYEIRDNEILIKITHQ